MKNNRPRNLGFILIGVGLVLVACGIYGLMRPAEFQACAKIRPEQLDDSSNGRLRFTHVCFGPTEIETIQSDAILSNAVLRLNLDSKSSKNPSKPKSVAILRSQLDVRRASCAALVDICATSEDSVEAALIANTVTEVYRDWRHDRVRRMVEAGIAEFEKLLAQHDQKLVQASNKVIRLMKELEIPDAELLKPAQQIAFGPLAVDESNASSFEAARKYKGRLEALEKLQKLDHNELVEVLPGFISDTTLSELTLEVKQCREAIQNTSTNDTVRLERLQTEMAIFEKRLDVRVLGVMQLLKQQLAESKKEVEQTNAASQARKEESQRQLSARRPFYDAKREFEEMGDYRRLIVRKINLEKANPGTPALDAAEIVERAIPPSVPIRRTQPLGMSLAIAGLVCSVWGVKCLRHACLDKTEQ